jgi:prophage antirepressor-like protein
MDVVKFFQSSPDKQVTINIQGTEDDPLFQASQIGELLGMGNIRSSLAGFDADEKIDGVHTVDAMGRSQSATFLTELGLYRLLGQSRLPVARPFQKWVATVVRRVPRARATAEADVAERIATVNAVAEAANAAAEERIAAAIEDQKAIAGSRCRGAELGATAKLKARSG